MTAHPYTRFVQWTMHTYFRGCWHDVDLSKPTVAWIQSFGVTAGRMDRFLKLGHPSGCTLPNSLVLDILELNNAPLSKTLTDEFLRSLLLTWTEMAEVYGRTSAPSHCEMNRLELLADWGHTLEKLPGSSFPGGCSLVLQYQCERARLDLTQLRKGSTSFKYVGIVLELLKLQERITVPCTLAAGPAPQPARRRTCPARKTPGFDASQKLRDSAYQDDRLPCLPTSRGRLMGPSTSLAYQLYGNWREDWRNTLP